MQLFDTTEVALERAMAGSALRQSALADNLANVNTPGYQRKDVDFHAALRDALDSGEDPGEVTFSVEADRSAVMRADGSTVDLDTEASALAQNGLEYEALTSVLKTRMDILRSAMGVI